MTNKNFPFSSTKRRGLSSIVGALIFVVLMVSTFAVIGVALNSQTDIASTNRDVAARDLEKLREDFAMNAFTTGSPLSNTLNVEVNNLGVNPLEIFSLTVTDNSGFYNTTRYNIPAQDSFIVSGDTKNILNSTIPAIKLLLPSDVNQTKIYTFKTISTLGNVATDNLICDEFGCSEPVVAAGEGSLSASLFLDGPNAINTKTSTIIMFVTNTSEETVFDVQPMKGFDGSDSCADFWSVDISEVTIDDGITEEITNCTVEPSTPQDMGPHETIVFKWDVTVGGDIGAEFEFCNRVQGDDLSPPLVFSTHVTTCTSPVEPGALDTVTVIDPNDCGGCGEGGEGGTPLILIEDLLVRPSIFMTIPSPFGLAGSQSNSERGLWGVNVANPTNSTMEVSKVTISAIVPGSQANDLVWWQGGDGGDGSGCNNGAININPDISHSWSCPTENIVMWKNQTDPVVLPPYTNESFNVKVQPWKLAANGRQLEAVLIQASVFSSSGSFGKSGYQTTILDPKAVIGSVHASKSVDGISDNDIITKYEHIQYNSTSQFHIVLSETDLDTETSIDVDAKLIINVPRQWTEVAVVPGNTTNFSIDEVKQHGDGSTQIIGSTTIPLGDAGVPESATISFTAKAPDPEINALYPMYVLGNGFSTNGGASFSVGPLSEIIMQVDAYVPP